MSIFLKTLNSGEMFLGVGLGYPHDSSVASWFSGWFLGLLLSGSIMISNKREEAQIKTVTAKRKNIAKTSTALSDCDKLSLNVCLNLASL